jgi:hypothetical protein
MDGGNRIGSGSLPRAAVHIPVGGDKEVRFENDTFKIRATPEASIKIGINF